MKICLYFPHTFGCLFRIQLIPQSQSSLFFSQAFWTGKCRESSLLEIGRLLTDLTRERDILNLSKSKAESMGAPYLLNTFSDAQRKGMQEPRTMTPSFLCVSPVPVSPLDSV